MSVIDKMVVQVGADIRPLVQGLADSTKEIQRTSKHIETSLDGMKKAFGALVTVEVGRRLALFGKEALDFAADIKDAAEAVGITTQSLQELRYAALDAGLDAGTLDAALVKLGTNLGDAATGTGSFGATLERLGISLTDSGGNLLGMDAMLVKVAEAIRTAGTEQERLSIATDAFGKGSAAGMVRILRDGAAGLDDVRTRAQELGVVMSDDLIERADEASKMFERLGLIISVNMKAYIADLIDTIVHLGEVWRWTQEQFGKDTFNNSGLTKLIQDRDALTEAWAKSPENVQLKEQIDHLNEVIALHRKAFQLSVDMQVAGAGGGEVAAPEAPVAAPRRGTSAAGRVTRSAPRVAEAQEDLRKAGAQAAVFKDKMKEAKEATRELGDALAGMGEDMSNAFSQAIIQGKGLRDVLGGLLQSVGGRFLNNTIGSVFDNVLGGVLKSVGARANGGPVLSGMPYVVGERGPELFVPAASGSIVPNGGFGGGGKGATVVQHITIGAGVSQTVRAEMLRMLPQLKEAAVAGVMDAQRRGRVA